MNVDLQCECMESARVGGWSTAGVNQGEGGTSPPIILFSAQLIIHLEQLNQQWNGALSAHVQLSCYCAMLMYDLIKLYKDIIIFLSVDLITSPAAFTI